MPSGGVSLGALGLIAGGVVLAYAGVNDPVGGPVGVVRSVLQGQLPQPGPQKKYAAPGAVGGALGGAAGRAATALVGRYNLGPVRPWTKAVAEEVGPKFGIRTIGGWRKFDQFPDHPSGLALDFMVDDLLPGGVNDTATGNAVAAYLIANEARLRVDYLIWNRRSWNPRRGTWADYTATSNPHEDHVHLTVLA